MNKEFSTWDLINEIMNLMGVRPLRLSDDERKMIQECFKWPTEPQPVVNFNPPNVMPHIDPPAFSNMPRINLPAFLNEIGEG